MNVYREIILEQYKNPMHWGTLEGKVVHSKSENPSCGDSIEMSVVLENSALKDAKFRGNGCAISIAATALLLEETIGMDVANISSLTLRDIENLLGGQLTPARVKCGTLGLRLLQDLVKKDK